VTTTPAGWYDDGHGAVRWWDGAQWTEHIREAEAAAAVAPAAWTASAPGVPVTGVGAASASPYYGATPGGTYLPAPPSPHRKSNLWVMWIAIGVLALGIVISAAVYLPMLIVGAVEDATTQPDGTQAALATISLYDEAWSEADCDKYMQSTTEAFREDIQLPDCATFEEQAAYFNDTTDDYLLEVTDVQPDDSQLVVSTTETYWATVDDSGAPLPEPEQVEEHWSYVLVPVDGGWAIDAASID
jgi:hypothetical protein